MSWAMDKYSKGAVKMHTLIDLRGSIPIFIDITDGRYYDSNILDKLKSDIFGPYVFHHINMRVFCTFLCIAYTVSP